MLFVHDLVVSVRGMSFLPRSLASLLACCTLNSALGSESDWPAYLGDKESSQYSELDQITAGNVQDLEIAWTWKENLESGAYSQIQCNPLVLDGVVFATDANIDLIALDGATGELLWELDPFEDIEQSGGRGVNRGLAYWENGDEGRILFGCDRYMMAVDPKTGRLIETFGDAGRVDLKRDLGREVEGLQVQANTPGVVFENLIIMGMRVGEGPAPAAPGFIRAYDVETGDLAWTFRTIPRPGEFGYETWPEDAYQKVGGANVWAGMSLDEERGLVFCPTGSAAFDFWGGHRHGANLFANCLLALDAKTGERVWHYQFVHHDLWDRDLPAPPNLLTIRRDGGEVPAVAQITKSGHVFVFHRETGEPLYPIEEVPVPSSDLAGESAWPTQPLPTKPEPFARQVFTANEITDISPESRKEVLERFARVRPHTPFMPPSVEGTIIFPGFDGGGEWGGAAVSPGGVLYVNANEMPWILTMVDASAAESVGEHLYMQNCAGCHGADRQGSLAQSIPKLVDIGERLGRSEISERIAKGKGVMPAFGFISEDERDQVVDYLLAADASRYAHHGEDQAVQAARNPWTHTGYRRWLDSDGYPAVKPPWGTLNAIDLNTGEFVWKTTLGEFPELIEQGIPPTGTENYGGPIVTKGGLLFIGASKDEHFRAFDLSTGEELWKHKLPAGGYATPVTYEVEGRQYVLIAAGGGKMGTASGNAYVAFALESGLQ